MADLELIAGELRATETPTEPKPKRKYVRRKKRAYRRRVPLTVVEPLASPDEPLPKAKAQALLAEIESAEDWLAGLDAINCAIGCCEGGCVITGPTGVCGHPHKGGLQHAYQQNKDVLARFKRAQMYLYHLAADAKRG